MGSVFDVDSKVYQIVTKIIDLIKLNILWMLCSFPIVTIGAATSALFYVTRKLAAGEDGYTARTFLKVFREQLFASFSYWLPIMAAIVVLWLDYWFFRGMIKGEHGWALSMVTFTLIAAYVLGMVSIHIFTMVTATPYRGKELWKHAMAKTFKYLPKSFLMFTWVLLAIVAAKIWAIAAFTMILLGGSSVALFQSYIMNGILKNSEIHVENERAE